MSELADSTVNMLMSGQKSLALRNWHQAREYFHAATLAEESPEALEYLGLASWWMDDALATFEAREKAYGLYRKSGDNRSAARVAIALAFDHFSFTGEYAVANGWSRRAHRLLEGIETVPEHAMLKIWDGHVAVDVHHDPITAFRLGSEAVSIARQLGDFDQEMMGIAIEGLALVCQGQVIEGMQRLDEVTTAAIAGEIGDLEISITVCCYLIAACERVQDYGRAIQWCHKVKEISKGGTYPLMFSLCQIHYAGVLLWKGDWDEAEKILIETSDRLISSRPAHAVDGIMLRAELYLHRGELEEAAELIKNASFKPFRMLGANGLILLKSALAYERGDYEASALLAERYIRNIPKECILLLPPALELLCLAHIMQGYPIIAQESSSRLKAIADTINTEPLRAISHFTEGCVSLITGRDSHGHFELAVELFEKSQSPFHASRARCGLAQSLHLLGQKNSAMAELEMAIQVFDRLQAVSELHRAKVLLKKISSLPVGQMESVLPEAFTKRELEILREIASGKDNPQIADNLFISIRTLERHISNIYGKIGATGKAARAVSTAYAHRNGLV